MMSPQHLSMNMNSSMNSLPITRHRLMKAKTFKQQVEQDQQQDQQQQQSMMLPLSSFSMAAAAVPLPTPAPIPVFVVTHNMRRTTTKSKSVRFNNCVHVAPFEKVTSTEAKDVWLTSMELAAIRTEGRELASTYRKLLLETQQNQSQSQESLSNYRGFENVTILRKRQKILANRSAIYAHLKGYKAEEIAFIYQQSTTFSTEIAFLQAIHDYAEIYTTNATSANDITTALQQQLPSVESYLPPTPLPFAIESAKFFQRQKREQRKNQNQNKKRTRSASSSRSRSRSPPLSPSPPMSPSMSPPISPIAFEQHVNVQQQQYCQQQQQQQQQQATTVTRRVRQRV